MAIKISDLSFIYNKGTFLEKKVLEKINLKIRKGEVAGIFGHTESGKSTLLFLIKNLLKPTTGKIEIEKGLKTAILFQNPSYQIFEKTVFEDVSFSLKKLNLSYGEKEKKVKEILERFSLNYEKIKESSPFSLSFGEMKKVALAGILVFEFDIFLFDEPLVSLDYAGKKIFFEILQELKEKKKTIIISSSNLKDFFSFVERIIIMNKGMIMFDGNQKQLIEKKEILDKLNLELPEFLDVLIELKKYKKEINLDITTIEEAKKEIIKCFF